MITHASCQLTGVAGRSYTFRALNCHRLLEKRQRHIGITVVHEKAELDHRGNDLHSKTSRGKILASYAKIQT